MEDKVYNIAQAEANIMWNRIVKSIEQLIISTAIKEFDLPKKMKVQEPMYDSKGILVIKDGKSQYKEVEKSLTIENVVDLLKEKWYVVVDTHEVDGWKHFLNIKFYKVEQEKKYELNMEHPEINFKPIDKLEEEDMETTHMKPTKPIERESGSLAYSK